MSTDPSPSITTHVQESEPIASVPCSICRRQFSRYTCPRCNIPYCSLLCFRSDSHAECAEAFYRQEIETEVRSEPSKTAEERRRTLELLKRFEEDALDDPLADPAMTDEDDGEDLAERLGELDIDNASYEELWAKLTPAERDKFVRALGDPSSELARQLLTREELERARIESWWEAPESLDADADKASSTRVPKSYGKRPAMMSVPKSLTDASSTRSGPSLLYNICAVCIAYAYVTRHLAASPLEAIPRGDPEHADARHEIARLVPFLTDRKSTTIHPSLSSVVTDLWSRFPSGEINPELFALLLRDTSTLIRPSTVTVVSPSPSSSSTADLSSHPSATLLLALSDVSALFSPPPQAPPAPSPTPPPPQKPSPAAHKLVFYAAHIAGAPPAVLRMLADEAVLQAEAVLREGGASAVTGTGPSGTGVGPRDVTTTGSSASTARPKIEELE
ncbi:hypothetical protein CERSUDRAFT_92834 [Gelatoporia subvermispora B]|uniref:HIT-type domain-containing protein n=1 Tax=Ceriporiopsis subvermispora (strain B) TaxID=914234 RepID=M2QP17_CERS8|nr:hypothetical protein CERSUDRAFT_92834 [Gelatoporia subvermispora B]